ncbi:transporter substrate-binding domain-containing protein [Pseudomonas sp. CAU 1711]|uniref:substrate-binding periplasmic protein n=1 Tax=Pseudomonas sp. CAU 1711 TaxID=3140356 RepID=UPI0032610C05
MAMLAASYRRLVGHLCAAFALSLLSPLCGALTIGAEDDWYPFTAYRGGRVVGMSVDIVRAAFETAGTSFELRPYPYARCMELTRLGKLPACFNTSPGPRATRDYLLPSEPLFRGWVELWSRRDEAAPIRSLEQIAGSKVAVTSGYDYGPAFESFAPLKRVPVRRQLNGFRMLQHGRVDFMVAYRGTARALFDDHPELHDQFAVVATLHRPQLFISFSRQHPDAPELLRRFDQGMRAIRANGRYQQILDIWQHGREGAWLH